MLNIPLPSSGHSVLDLLIGLLVLKARPFCSPACLQVNTNKPNQLSTSGVPMQLHGPYRRCKDTPRRHQPGNRLCKSVRGVALLYPRVSMHQLLVTLFYFAHLRGAGAEILPF